MLILGLALLGLVSGQKTHGLQTLSNEVINLPQIVHKSKRQVLFIAGNHEMEVK